MDVEVISTDLIQPSKSTPLSCKTYKLSILDQCLESCYVPVVFFYKYDKSYCQENNVTNTIAKQLKSSLSHVLNIHYPFAGKVKGVDSIDCNDEGVLFVEAQSKIKLFDMFTQPEPSYLLNTLFPNDLQWKSSKNRWALAIQLTYFQCGGLSIATCFSHKIADANTICTFLNYWAAISRGSDDRSIECPLFGSFPIFQPDDKISIREKKPPRIRGTTLVTRRFVFSTTKILELKALISNTNGSLNKPVTRVEAVSSLLFKSIIHANNNMLRSLEKTSKKAYVFTQMVDLRSRTDPSLPRNCMGNYIWHFPVVLKDTDVGDKDHEMLEKIIYKIREGLGKVSDFCKNAQRIEWLSQVKNSSDSAKKGWVEDVFMGFNSSWCKFPFYDVDFGWGKPLWATVVGSMHMNGIFLMDTRDGKGIEALVTLDEHIMTKLQEDREFLRFINVNDLSIVLEN